MQRESEYRVAQELHGLDVVVSGRGHGIHISFNEGVHGRIEDLGERKQALDVRAGLVVLLGADYLTAHVHARRKVVRRHARLLAQLAYARASLHARRSSRPISMRPLRLRPCHVAPHRTINRSGHSLPGDKSRVSRVLDIAVYLQAISLRNANWQDVEKSWRNR